MKKNNLSIGGLLVIVGGLLLAARFLFNKSFISLRADDFWPIIILMLGAGFELAYYVSRRAPGLLVPGGMLTTYGLLFFFEAATNFRFAAYTWPIYLVGIVVGLFQLYMHIGRPKGLLVAMGIIGGIAAASFIVMFFRLILGFFDFGVLIPVLLLAGGLIMVLGNRNKAGSGNW